MSFSAQRRGPSAPLASMIRPLEGEPGVEEGAPLECLEERVDEIRRAHGGEEAKVAQVHPEDRDPVAGYPSNPAKERPIPAECQQEVDPGGVIERLEGGA